MRSIATLALLALLPVHGVHAAKRAQTPPKSCAEAEQKQFDFWVGEWELTWPGQKPGETGRGGNSIKIVMGGCVVEELVYGR